MKFTLTCLFHVYCIGICYSQSTWNGSTSSDWNTSSNWTPSGVPTSTAAVIINNASAPNQPVLDMDRGIGTLSISAGTLDLNGRTLAVGTDIQITGGVVTNLAADTAKLSSANFSQLTNATINNVRIIRTNGGPDAVNEWSGGNNFTNVIIRNNGSGSRAIRMATTTADVFNGTTRFDLPTGINAGIRVSYTANSTFNGNIAFFGDGSILTFGENGGSTTLASGFALKDVATSKNTRFIFNNFTQNGTATNDTLRTGNYNLTITNSTFGGAVSVVGGNGSVTSVTGSTLSNGFTVSSQLGSISISNSQLSGENYLFALAFLEITNSTFSNLSGGTTIIRQGGSTNDLLSGGNTFHNLTVERKGGTNAIYFANVSADTYNGTTTIISSGLPIYMAHKGNNTFNGDIVLSYTTGGSTIFFLRWRGGGHTKRRFFNQKQHHQSNYYQSQSNNEKFCSKWLNSPR